MVGLKIGKVPVYDDGPAGTAMLGWSRLRLWAVSNYGGEVEQAVPEYGQPRVLAEVTGPTGGFSNALEVVRQRHSAHDPGRVAVDPVAGPADIAAGWPWAPALVDAFTRLAALSRPVT